jgi:kynurenine formamidase
MDIEDVVARAERYSNWGRWGTDDELGTLNAVEPTDIVRAAALVRRGVVFALGAPIDYRGPFGGFPGRWNPIHTMLKHGGDVLLAAIDGIRVAYTDDAISMPLQCVTQWDALAHVFFDGRMYNGFGPELVTADGAARNAITGLNNRAVGRGVLLDIAAHEGVDVLPDGYVVGSDVLEACADRQGVAVGRGDFVLVRTGVLGVALTAGAMPEHATSCGTGSAPGFGVDACDFFCPRDVAAVAIDSLGFEAAPLEEPTLPLPLHAIMLVRAGIHLGEAFCLDELAADCAGDGVYEFLFVAPPLPVTGGVGTPVNPQAIK